MLAGAKDRSRDVFVNGDRALLLDGFVLEGKIHCVDPQVCVAGIGETNADAIAAHNPTRARHYGSEKIPELEIGNQVIGQFQEKANTLVLLQQLLLRGLRCIKEQRIVECEGDLLSHY
jgi:hypothetical protein